jgi:GntR family transcriptional regulator
MNGDTVMLDDESPTFEIGSLDPADPLPLYQQLRDRLRGQLLEGWPRDRPIPSERQLMQMTGLSRMTVRQAIAELVHEGMLRRDHGRGTFVADSRIMRLLTGHSSFKEVVQQQGSTPATWVMRQERVRANQVQATLLQIEPGEAVFDLVRVRAIDEQPVMVDYTIVPERICPSLENADLSRSLYEYLSSVCAIPPDHSTDTIEAVAAQGEIAQLLAVPDGFPLLLMRRLALSVDNIPIEITDEYVRTDRCLYQFENPSGVAGLAMVNMSPQPEEENDE